MSDERRRYYGKFRGTVVSTVDPGLKGRISALITVGGAPLTVIAEACTPYPGFYAIPPEGSGVWIEFEEGDLDKPIWTGCWWRDGEVMTILSPDLPPPDPVSAPKTVVLAVSVARTPGIPSTARLKLSAATGTATLESLLPPGTPALPTSIKLSPAGIDIGYTLNTVSIKPSGVDINKNGLVVLPAP
jgi:hypothetical protein